MSPEDGRALRWEAHNRARRQQVLDAAIELVEEGPVGIEPSMAAIATRAGLQRTVIHRHFGDRRTLDAAIEGEAATRLARELLPMLDPDRPVIEIIHDSIAVYVRWSEEHPALRWIVDRGARAPSGPVQERLSETAQIVTDLVLAAVDGLSLPVTETEKRYVDPLVHGLVEAVVGTVRRWVVLEDPPPTRLLVHLASESVWFIMAGHAHALGVELRRDQRLSDLPRPG